MSKIWPKVIRDPVHNIIPFEDNPCDRLLLDLINTREFQRLRRIKQLGMSEVVFPGANHSRFAHCIGVMHVARRMADRVWPPANQRKVDPEQRKAVLVAALLHDVGHGPFSHAFEKVTSQKHEARTLEIIRDPKTEVGRCLQDHDRSLPARLAAFFDEDVDNEKRRRPAEIPDHLKQIVSSQLDADRFDYLLRDSYAAGVDYGRFDLDWLLLQLRFDGKHGRLYIGRKAMDAAEAYVFARHHMYRAVYFHKTVRAAEVMLYLAFRRFKHLANEAGNGPMRTTILPHAPPHVLDAFTEKMSLDSYLKLDDASLVDFFKSCASASDKILGTLGRGLVERKLYKSVDVTDSQSDQVEKFGNEARGIVGDAGLDVEHSFVADVAADTPYKPYNPDIQRPASQIYVESAGGENVEISTRSDALVHLRKPYSLVRYYFPESIRSRIEEVAKNTLSKERKK
ncbi:MAG: HD domain-containing protein [Planctomycetes bacterium]|nr:HD domain-containing protein [Planctomycetota bacterium]